MSGDDYYDQRTDAAGKVVEVEHGDGPMHTRSEAIGTGLAIAMSGRPQRNEEGVREVCALLAKAINHRTGEDWQADEEEPPGLESGVDWYLRSSRGGLWGVQVTRVGLADRWARSARGERVEEKLSISDAATEIWDAIERKARFSGGILALAVGQPGAHAFRGVVEEFRSKYTQKTQQVRFSEVWLVGYSLETTVRVHPR